MINGFVVFGSGCGAQAGPAAPRRRDAPRRRQATLTVAQRLEMGARIGAFVAANPDLVPVPWRRVAREVFRCTPSDALAKRHQRAYAEWLGSAGAGRLTAYAAGAETRTLRRRKPHERQAAGRHKGEYISFELLQWFVDNIERHRNRADSRIMLDEARRLRSQLVSTGVPETELPKINRGWLFRWRKARGIAIRRGTVTFQISWQKAKDRIRCMMGNIFRLRRLWALCHPGTPMRWLSMDQKPSWMNNAARRPMYARQGRRDVGAKENHAATRDRYTILTFVPSWEPPAGSPPPLAVLFKAATGARLAPQIQHPPWMKLQFQERGSYRADDVVDALEWALPPASCSAESVVVLLDWFSAHLTPEVQEAIRGRGHVVLYHGGGVTGLEQVNDTHLHAVVQRLMEQLETGFMAQTRFAAPEKIATLGRQDVVDIVSEMWRSVDHKNVREKGYSQTGPCLPEGAGTEDIFVDLRPVWEAIDGPALREASAQYVDEKWADGSLASWADVDLVIEHHIPHPANEEGLEAAEWDVGGPEDGDPEDDDDGADDDDGFGPGGIGDQGVLGGAGPSGGAGSPGGAGSSGGAGSAGGAGSSGGAEAAGGLASSCGDSAGGLSTDPAYIDALRRVAAVASQTRNDRLMKPVLQELRRSTLKRSCAGTAEAEALRAAAKEEQRRIMADRVERRELERQAKLADLQAQTALEEAKRQAASARHEALVASAAMRADALQEQEASARARRVSVWLQTQYPLALARRLLAWRQALQPAEVQALEAAVKGLVDTQRCSRLARVPVLWEADKKLSKASCYVCLPGSGSKRTPVRCDRDFEWCLFGEAWAIENQCSDAAVALAGLLDRICPRGSLPFRRRYTMNHLLETCDCIAPQAFVHAVILLSKWLGRDLFPQGVFRWPPEPPAEVQ